MPISLYNSLTRRTEPFAPLDPERVTMYLCGPTVYNYVHIGNARGPVVFDVLVRLLRRHYPHVVYARNITDVDDKINAAAQQQGVQIDAITNRFAQAYRDDMAGLGVAPPDIEPHATTHIAQIVTMIEALIDGGHAYAAEGHVLFDVGSFADYGKLSGRDPDELIAGARVEVAPYKRNAGDFVLWKPSTPELPGWDSPWGRGRPGWHIECSAMSAAHLGETIDIHAGGVDLLFPHHENEVAQSTCAHGGKVFARWWMHNGMLTFGGSKMSKSLGNIEKVHDLLQRHAAEALRYALLSAHYRQPLDWSTELVEQSTRTLDRLYGTLRELAPIEVTAEIPIDVEQALQDDLNTPIALAAMNAYAKQARHLLTHETAPFEGAARAELAVIKSALLGAGNALGLLDQDHQAWFQHSGTKSIDETHVEDLLEQRRAARASRDFARADAIREELAALGIAIEDGAQGTRWSIVKA
ncbi:cysteine--tRNA ligase [Rhodanobacter sp. Root561]|uniref:cysteine--tRNA ligase n=1 Tax=Rhodanobacter sp. Root561 TaxID=1736560 RepID=UPI0007019C16|nr:cysteine--tRNA ligase [Rhodanobacter sp. Root561]KQZ74453.1 cysteine--tRNA ligase [Rhodanobacter sp. Root561]